MISAADTPDKERAGRLKRRILLVGEPALPYVSSGNLATALRARGYDCVFSERTEYRSTREWLAVVRRTDTIVAIVFDGPDMFAVRQLALAAAIGRRIVRWWVGSDVLACLESAEARRGAIALDRVVARNVAVAPHLVDELASIGIQSAIIPSFVSKPANGTTLVSQTLPRGVLVYLPTNRLDFYGIDVVRGVIEANHDLPFIVVGDESHTLASYANVSSLGWIRDFETVWESVGVVLRITKHDGLPRVILDALLRSRYAIYAWPLTGCWQARTVPEVNRCLFRFRKVTEPNHEGLKFANELLQPEPGDRFDDLLRTTERRRDVSRRLAAMEMVVSDMASKVFGRRPPKASVS